MVPSSGWRQRSSASTAAIATGLEVDDRLVLKAELIALDSTLEVFAKIERRALGAGTGLHEVDRTSLKRTATPVLTGHPRVAPSGASRAPPCDNFARLTSRPVRGPRLVASPQP